jgi:hypothetical protein
LDAIEPEGIIEEAIISSCHGTQSGTSRQPRIKLGGPPGDLGIVDGHVRAEAEVQKLVPPRRLVDEPQDPVEYVEHLHIRGGRRVEHSNVVDRAERTLGRVADTQWSEQKCGGDCCAMSLVVRLGWSDAVGFNERDPAREIQVFRKPTIEDGHA